MERDHKSTGNPEHKISVFDSATREYGIKEIIGLLSHVSPDQDVLFGAEMIKRTLSSMRISIPDILDDALEKEMLAKQTIDQLKHEISDYFSRIEHLKSQIEGLNGELEDIQQARKSLTENDESLLTHVDQMKTLGDPNLESNQKNSEPMDKEVPEAPQMQAANQSAPRDEPKAVSKTTANSNTNTSTNTSTNTNARANTRANTHASANKVKTSQPREILFDDDNGLDTEAEDDRSKGTGSSLKQPASVEALIQEGPSGYEGPASDSLGLSKLLSDEASEIDAIFEDGPEDSHFEAEEIS